MMKSHISSALKRVFSDWPVAIALSVLFLICISYCLFVIFSLHPSDLQVAVHYTAFGDTNFYRERWYYLLSFVGFGLLMAVVPMILAIKIHLQERRQLALAFIWLSIFFMVIAWILTRAVLGVAFPS